MSYRVSRWPRLAAILAAVAALPSIAATPRLDERIHPYGFTAQGGSNPLRLFADAITTVPEFLDLGNFRPGGRMIEWSGQWLVGQIALFFSVPTNVAFGIVRLVVVAARRRGVQSGA